MYKRKFATSTRTKENNEEVMKFFEEDEQDAAVF